MTESEIMKALEWCELFTDNIVLSNKKGEKFTFALQSLQTIKQVLKDYNRKNAENEMFADIGKMYSEIKAEARAEAIKEFAERVNATTWYRINTKGELVVGANSETDVPLYKAEDICQIAKEMGVEL